MGYGGLAPHQCLNPDTVKSGFDLRKSETFGKRGCAAALRALKSSGKKKAGLPPGFKKGEKAARRKTPEVYRKRG